MAKKNHFDGSHLFRVMWKAFHALKLYDERSIASQNISFTDFVILEVLLHRGSLPVSAIGEKVLLTSGSITTAVDRLQKRELVYRRQCSRDRRIFYVELTEAGRELIVAAFENHARHLDKGVSHLTTEEISQLIALLKKTGTQIDSLNRQKTTKDGEENV